MEENTNRSIALNSAILYGKMGISTLCGLLTTRFLLISLGVNDFGLFTVVGGIISFIAIFNTIMLSTSNRFIAVAIGKGNMVEANKQFNVNLVIHVCIAIIAVIVAIPLGVWYIPRYVNYDGPLKNAMLVYWISIFCSAFSFVGVPYNGLLMAKEKFIVFSAVDVVQHVLSLVLAWVLLNHFANKLIIYAFASAFFALATTLTYIFYCVRHYTYVVRIRRVRDKDMYKRVFKFSAWVSFGAFAQVVKDQGAALVVNTFFNTAMNTAMGIASSVNRYVGMFANNVTQPMAPQITKSYAAGNNNRTDELLVMSTKFSFLLVLLMGAPFLIAPDWILDLWLGEAPPFAAIFLVLFVVDKLIQSFNSGLSNILWASGKIGLYQVLVSSINILSVVVGFFVLKGGAAAYYLTVTYICFSVVRFFCIQWTLHRTLNYDNRLLWKKSYMPSLLILLLFVPTFILPDAMHPALKIVISLLYLSFLEWTIGLDKNYRRAIIGFLTTRIKMKINR